MDEDDFNLDDYFSTDSIFRLSEFEDEAFEEPHETISKDISETEKAKIKTDAAGTQHPDEKSVCSLNIDPSTVVHGKRQCEVRAHTANRYQNIDAGSYMYSSKHEDFFAKPNTPKTFDENLEVFTKGEKRNGKTLTLLIGEQERVELPKEQVRRSRSKSSSDLTEPGLTQNLICFFTKLTTKMKNKSKSMDDLDKKSRFSRRECLQGMKMTLRGMFSPRKLSLCSEFDMLGLYGKHLGGIVPTTQATCWLFFRGGNELVRLTHEGITLECIGISVTVDDMTIDGNERMYVSCPQTKMIRRIDQHRRVSIIYHCR